MLVEKERKNHDQTIFYYASSAPLSSCRSAFDEFRPGKRANYSLHLSRSLERWRLSSQRRFRHAVQVVRRGGSQRRRADWLDHHQLERRVDERHFHGAAG